MFAKPMPHQRYLFNGTPGPPPTSSNTAYSRGLYRSNSSLDLDHNEIENSLRREFGSVSSIDALGHTANGHDAPSFFSVLKEYRSKAFVDHPTRSAAAPPRMHEYLQRRMENNLPPTHNHHHHNGPANNGGPINSATSTSVGMSCGNLCDESNANSLSSHSLATLRAEPQGGLSIEEATQSPKAKTKFQKLWESRAEKSERTKTSKSSKITSDEKAISSNGSISSAGGNLFRKLRSSTAKNETLDQQSASSSSTTRLDDPEVRFEEKLRRKAFAHFDCQSMTANLNYANRLCNMLAKRRNTTTGASAASMLSRNPDLEVDEGDGRGNDLLQSCPYFRNELGGEEERMIALNRITNDRTSIRLAPQSSTSKVTHRPNMACGLSLLEDANDRRWKLKSCPYQKLANEKSFIIENYDIGATYYRDRFYGLEHQNWFGIDENLGPVAVSIRKERINLPLIASDQSHNNRNVPIKHQYRLIMRTSELTVLRGTVHEDCIPSLSSSSSSRHHHSDHHAKELLEYVAPEITLPCLRLGVSNADEQLLKLDEQVLTRTYKVGVLYCRNGQNTEEEMYNNEHSSPAFEEFLSLLGERVRLKGFEKYRAGLDNKTDTTGLYSVYTTYNDCEIQFHCSTLLPYTPNNRQQLLRKRHIGNDIVTIVFQEPDAKPFTPKTIRSHFQHVFIIVRLLPGNGSAGPLRYAVSVSRSKDVPVFGPMLDQSGIYTKSPAFTEFLLSKIINAENAAHRSEKFKSMAVRTRHEYLKDLGQNYITNTTINDLSSVGAGAKFVSTIFGSKKRRAGRFVGDSAIKGAILWELSVEDYGQATLVDCLVGISSDTFLIIDESTKEVIFVCPNASILGWTSHPSHVKIFFHQGECILLKCKDPDLDEIGEVVSRLKCVTPGCEAQEIILRRNNHGHLGFHVGQEGLVTDVKNYSFAWQAGLRQNFRIVEICKVAIATLDHEAIVDLLKTSIHVTITVLPPRDDGSPRRGCNLTNCSYLTSLTNGNSGDYENITGMLERMSPAHDGRPGIRSRSHTPNKVQSASHFTGSKSLPVSPEEAHLLHQHQQQANNHRGMVGITTSSIYSNQRPLTPGSVRSSSRYNALTPKMGTMVARNPSTKVTSSPSSDLHNNDFAPKHFGNLVSVKSELSLANKSALSSPSNSLSRDLGQLPSRLQHSHSYSHWHHFVKLNENTSLATANSVGGGGGGGAARQDTNGATSAKKTTSDYHSDTSSNECPSNGTWSLPPMNSNGHDYVTNGHGLPPNANHPANTPNSSRGDREREVRVQQVFNRTKSLPKYNQHEIRNGASERIRASNKSSGSSCSSSSTLQEDLLKLINPDYLADPVECEGASSSSAGTSTTQYSTPYSSLERSEKGDDVILTVAKPAHVIPSSSNESSPSDFASSKSKPMISPRNSPLSPCSSVSELAKSKATSSPRNSPLSPCSSVASKSASLNFDVSPTLPVVTDSEVDLDWPSLVDTATKAMALTQQAEAQRNVTVLEESLAWLKEFGGVNLPGNPSNLPSESVKELENTVKKLQVDLVKEQSDKATLAQQVSKLREENIRLHEESQTAAAQLRKFTEWFFQNINAK